MCLSPEEALDSDQAGSFAGVAAFYRGLNRLYTERKMRVILRENIENLGRKGDIVDVAAGYGRNFLIPKKLALEVTPSNMKMIEMQQRALKKKFDQEKASFQDIIDKLNETRLTFIRKTAEKDIIFGSVSSADIREALSEQGMDVDKKKVMLDEPIKRLGNYTVPIKIFHDERAEVSIEVITEGEAKAKEEKEKMSEKIEEKKAEAVVEEVKADEPPEEKREDAEKEIAEAKEKEERKEETAETVIVEKEKKEQEETAETVLIVPEGEKKEEEKEEEAREEKHLEERKKEPDREVAEEEDENEPEPSKEKKAE